jgi:uncharacterized protein (TIGR00725 family)
VSDKFIIAVCGAGTADPATESLAEAVGREIAGQGARLICGGLGGVMAAACKGAKSAGGQTIGILPGRQTAEANAWVEVPVATGLAEGRNLIIIYTADGVIALPGGSGTLSEIAFSLKIGKPVVDYGEWGIHGMIPAGANPKETVRLILQKLSIGKA